MIEDALREAFKAKAGVRPPSSLDGIADVAIRNAGRVRRRRRTAVAGFAAFIVMAVAAIATFHAVTPGAPTDPIAQGDSGKQQTAEPSATPDTQTAPPAVAREVDAIDGQSQPTLTVKLQLPDHGTVAAAYKATDGYLVVNTESDGDKQLVLQNEQGKQSTTLVTKASDIAVAKDGDKVAWAQEGKMTVAARTTEDKNKKPKLTEEATADVPDAAVPVTFVGSDLVMGREEGAGYDVWYAGSKYTQSWDATVVRIFGVHPDAKSVYAEVKPTDSDESMCLALLGLKQPFKVLQRRCGLPVAAKAGGRVSPDGHWLAYPVQGLKQVATLDLTKLFAADTATASAVATAPVVKTWTLNVTTKTMWINALTFVVDSGGKFRAISPAAGTSEALNSESESEGVVLIQPLYSG